MHSKVKLSLLILAGIAFLSGAAYLAMIYVVPNFSPTKGLAPAAGPGGKKSISVQLTRATELPPQSPEISGPLTELKDNSLMVTATGKDGSAANGVTFEVVITRETRIYRDVTFDNVSKSQIISGAKVQMQIAPAALADLQTGDMVQAWGARTGDRIVADTVLVMQNVVIQGAPIPGKGN